MEGSKQLTSGTGERSKKRFQPWIKAAVHYSLCFVVGSLAAFVPLVATGGPSAATIRASFLSSWSTGWREAAPPPPPDIGLLMIVTVTRPDGGMEQDASLARLAHTLRHVAPPLLWIVVGAENRTATARAVQVLRGTGFMFRHLTYDAGNLTDADAGDEANYQRNVALSHIERHRLNGVVHFAGASAVYDLRFFQELRRTRPFAAWPVATISPADQRVTIQGPTCNSSQITGWYREDSNTNATERTPMADTIDTSAGSRNSSSEPPKINISGFGFRSSMLWDSERSPIRRNSSENATQDYIQFIRQMMTTDEIKLMNFQCDCSEKQLMLWHLEMPIFTPVIEERETKQQQNLTETEGRFTPIIEEQENKQQQNITETEGRFTPIIEEQETKQQQNITETEGRFTPIIEEHETKQQQNQTETEGRFTPIIEEQETKQQQNLTETEGRFTPVIEEQETKQQQNLTETEGRFTPIIEEQETKQQQNLTETEGRFTPIIEEQENKQQQNITETEGRFTPIIEEQETKQQQNITETEGKFTPIIEEHETKQQQNQTETEGRFTPIIEEQETKQQQNLTETEGRFTPVIEEQETKQQQNLTETEGDLLT